MPAVRTPRLILHPVDALEARRIHTRTPAADDRWSDDYPFDGDIVALTVFLAASERDGDQRPFGYYRITQRTDGNAVGGIGFKGQPVDGAVEVGYGLAPSARGRGYAAEALTALNALAAGHGVVKVCAETTAENRASWRTLERVGFVRVADGSELLRYELDVG